MTELYLFLDSVRHFKYEKTLKMIRENNSLLDIPICDKESGAVLCVGGDPDFPCTVVDLFIDSSHRYRYIDEFIEMGRYPKNVDEWIRIYSGRERDFSDIYNCEKASRLKFLKKYETPIFIKPAKTNR
jgi:hypothetical protein